MDQRRSLKEMLWDAGYAMAEPFIKMPEPNKFVLLVAFAELLFFVVSTGVGIDHRIVVGTVLGSMMAACGVHIRLYDNRYSRS